MSTEPVVPVSPPPSPALSWLRAVLLMALVLLNTLAALPSLRAVTAERLERPFEQAELGRWQALLGRLGLEVSREWLAAQYVALAGVVQSSRALVLAPLSWWMQLTQTEQSWPLFGTPDSFSPAFRLQVWDSSGERVLYESGDAERDWQADLLGYRRVRASYNPSRSSLPHTYPGLCQRLSELVFAAQPEVQRVRCAIVRRAVAVPGEEPGREPEEEHVIDIARAPG